MNNDTYPCIMDAKMRSITIEGLPAYFQVRIRINKEDANEMVVFIYKRYLSRYNTNTTTLLKQFKDLYLYEEKMCLKSLSLLQISNVVMEKINEIQFKNLRFDFNKPRATP